VTEGSILLVSVIKNSNGAFTAFDGTDFDTIETATPTMNAVARRVQSYYKIISATGTETLTWTWTGTTSATARFVVLSSAAAPSVPAITMRWRL
jgi:hypothetical protein